MAGSGIIINYERAYGMQNVVTHSGDFITVASRPDWNSFVDSIESVRPQDVGRFVLSPELITVSDIDLREVAMHQGKIEQRIERAKDLSREFPGTTLVLGTVAFEPLVEKPRNAVLFLENGAERGRSYKASPIVKKERETFQEARFAEEVRKPAERFLSIICSDLVTPPPIDDSVDTVLISSCWATPSGYPGVAPTPERRIEPFTTYLVEELFSAHANVQTVIMADRLPGNSKMQGPFNFVARRNA